jgi:hypothetical protein
MVVKHVKSSALTMGEEVSTLFALKTVALKTK